MLTAVALFATNANQGQSVTLSVTVGGGTPPFTYQWMKQVDTSSPAVPITGATGATLVIPSVASGDTGVYSVVVANLAGATTSDTATLTVLPIPPTGLSVSVQITTQTLPTPKP